MATALRREVSQLEISFEPKVNESPARPVGRVGAVGILELSDVRRHKGITDRLEEVMKNGAWFTWEQIDQIAGYPKDPMRRLRDLRKRGWTLDRKSVLGKTTAFQYRIWK